MKTFKYSFSILALTAFTTGGLVACGDDTTDNTNPPDMTQADSTYIRVLHLSPDAPAVDLLANGELRAVRNLGFGAGTDYLKLDAGTYDLDIVPTGGDVSSSVLKIEGLSLMKDKRYTAVAIGTLNGIQALALEDDFAGLEGGKFRIRPIHAASGVGQVDIWNVADEGDASLLYENVDFGVSGNYLDLPVGAYTLGFDLNDDTSPDVFFDVPQLPAGTIVNAFATNDSDGNVFISAQLQDSNQDRIDARLPEPELETASVRVLHLSPDAPAVDIWANGSLRVIEDLGFSEGTGYLEVEAGTYDFDITPAGTSVDSSVYTIFGATLEKDTKYTVVAFDRLESLQTMILVDEYTELGADHIRVRPIHAASAVGQVDIWSVSANRAQATMLYEDVDFGIAGEYIDLPVGEYTLGFDVNNDAQPDVIFDIPELAAGTVTNVFAVTDSSDAISLKAQLNMGELNTIGPAM